MSDLSKYLSTEFEKTQERIAQVNGLLREVGRMFRESREPARADWPYSWDPTDPDDERHFPPNKEGKQDISLSTQAMCCVAICSLLEADDDYSFLNTKKEDLRSDLEGFLKSTVAAVLERLKTPTWYSSTYGKDDVFTASWLLLLSDKLRRVQNENLEWPAGFKERVVEIIAHAITDEDSHRPQVERTVFLRQTNEAGPHALPLLKIVKSLSITRVEDLSSGWPSPGPSREELLTAAGKWFEKNLHRQMSFYQFLDFRFDAAEMIFCLSGAIETGVIDRRDTIVPHVFDIVEEAQKRSVYWRPYRPMLSDPQGKVLLPLSVEVATTLLETLESTSTFHAHREALEKYFQWLASQKLEYERNGVCAGWHSENAYETDKIHVWDTSLIAVFFVDYVRALDREIQRELKRKSKLTVRTPDSLPHLLDDLVQFDLGLAANPESAFPMLKRDFLLKGGGRRQMYSLLLYGPPGVSKTTLAQALAKELGWDLVYLSPSDFIAGGEAEIEERAKTIFACLSALKRCLIFFDEIDRMILDRLSPAYLKQGDMFQMMTPAMLTKFTDLHKQKLSVFIVATNFAEHIDDAVKREGRIDHTLLCLPFDLIGRTEQLRKLIDERYESLNTKVALKSNPTEPWPSERLERLKQFAKRLPLCVFEELSRIVRQATKSLPGGAGHGDFCENAVVALTRSDPSPGQIALESYPDRIADPDFRQKPYEEYLSLLLLQGESDPREADRKEFRTMLSQWQQKTPREYKLKHKKIEETAESYGLSLWLETKSAELKSSLAKKTEPKSSAAKKRKKA